MTNHYTISVVIPTRNRPENLKTCLLKISRQTDLPEEVIIVDDGNQCLDQTKIRAILPDSVPLTVTESEGPASTSTARNTGAELASSQVVLFLDDDVLLAESYIEHLRNTYKKRDRPELAGIGGFDSNIRTPSAVERLFNLVFYLSYDGWNINECGMQSWERVSDITIADWLSGNNASYKRSIIQKYPFPHWEGGREALEDIAMGFKLKKEGYWCLINPGLRLDHEETGIVDGDFSHGLKQGKNRIRIFRNWGNQWYLPLFIWAYFGTALRQFLAPIANGELQIHWQTGAGISVAPLHYAFDSLMNEKETL